MPKKQELPLENFDEFAQRGQRVVAHYADPNCMFPKKREQALRIVRLAKKTAELVAKSSKVQAKDWRAQKVKDLQTDLASILRHIGGRTRASKTGFTLSLNKAISEKISLSTARADSLLNSFERLGKKPVTIKKKRRRHKK